MQLKKVLYILPAVAMLVLSAFGTTAEDSGTSTATHTVFGNEIVGSTTNDVTVNFDYDASHDASATVTADITEDAETAFLVRNVDFEAPDIPAGTSLVWNTSDINGSVNGGVLSISARTLVTLATDVCGDYTATFHIRTNSRAADRIFFGIKTGYFLELRGTSTEHGATDDSGKAISYAAAISTGNVWDGSGIGMYDVIALNPYPTLGYWVKFEVVDKTINVWLCANKNWTGEFTGEPTLTYTAETDFADISDLTWYSNDGGYIYVDNLNIECETFAYENDYDMQAYNSTGAVLTTDETGNTTYVRGITSDSGDWSRQTLFTVPENYQMHFRLFAGDKTSNRFRIYLKNDINILVAGDSVTDTGKSEIRLCNGTESIKTYVVGSAGDILHDIPFTAGYVKVVFRGELLQVYMSNNSDFTDSYKILEHTFDGLTTTNNTIDIYGDDTEVTFDDFKVYDIYGADYKQVILNGTDITLIDIADGSATEIGAYTLPLAGARYRISVAKANGKLTVYVNGKAAITTDSTAAGLMYFDGKNYPTTVIGTDAPIVISAGDLDYNESVNADDLLKMKKILLGLDKTVYVTEAVNADGDAELEVDIRDFIRIKKIIAGVA